MNDCGAKSHAINMTDGRAVFYRKTLQRRIILYPFATSISFHTTPPPLTIKSRLTTLFWTQIAVGHYYTQKYLSKMVNKGLLKFHL